MNEMKKTTDWNGKWFQIRVDKGQSDLVTFQYLDENSKRVDRNFHHRETDGYGALMLNLARDGYAQFQPPSKTFPPPSVMKRFFLLFKGLLNYPGPPKLIWKNWRPQAQAGSEDVAWLTFTDDMETFLLQQSEKLNVNATSYLLAVLATVCREELCKPSDEPNVWLMPVNMRGSFPEMSFEQNCVSFLPLKTTREGVDHEARSIYQQLRTGLKQKWHWAFWEVGQIGRWIGYSGMKLLASKSDQSYWTGTFSDLGNWENEALKNDPVSRRTWIIAPPGSANYPLGATCLKWFGRRTVTLKIHPSIALENVSTTVLADRILQKMKFHFQKDFLKPTDAWKSSDSRNSVPLEP